MKFINNKGKIKHQSLINKTQNEHQNNGLNLTQFSIIVQLSSQKIITPSETDLENVILPLALIFVINS